MMDLDELARRAVAELRHASGKARFTVWSPSAGRRALRPALALALTAVVALGATMLWQTVRPSEPVGTATREPITDVGDLVTALYAALNAKDDAAFRELTVPGFHAVFTASRSPTGDPITGTGERVAHEVLDLAEQGYLLVEVTGEPLISGRAIAVPVRYVYAEGTQTGFDLLVLDTVGDELKIVGGVTFFATRVLTADPRSPDTVSQYVAAWNDGEAERILDSFDPRGAMWDSIEAADPGDIYRGEDLGGFVRASLWFDVELTSDLVTSGPFVAVANRLYTTSDEAEGISIFLIADGLILLHAFAQ